MVSFKRFGPESVGHFRLINDLRFEAKFPDALSVSLQLKIFRTILNILLIHDSHGLSDNQCQSWVKIILFYYLLIFQDSKSHNLLHEACKGSG